MLATRALLMARMVTPTVVPHGMRRESRTTFALVVRGSRGTACASVIVAPSSVVHVRTTSRSCTPLRGGMSFEMQRRSVLSEA